MKALFAVFTTKLIMYLMLWGVGRWLSKPTSV